MNQRSRMPARLVLALTWVVLLPNTSFAQVKVLISGGFYAAFQNLVPQFENTTGITVTATKGASQGNGPKTIGAQLRRGVPADVVIMSKEGLNALVADNRIVVGTVTDLAQTPLGVSVREGTPKPDVSTVGAFKRTLLQAKSITFPGSTTGIYMTTKLFPQLGIANEISGKITHVGVAAVARGESELAIQPVSELLNVKGVDFAGTIPAEIQYISVFSAATVAGSRHPEASGRLIAFLASEKALPAIQKSGMQRLKPR